MSSSACCSRGRHWSITAVDRGMRLKSRLIPKVGISARSVVKRCQDSEAGLVIAVHQ